MNTALPDPSSTLLANLPSLLPKLEALYKDVHAHPELSMQEDSHGGSRGEASRGTMAMK